MKFLRLVCLISLLFFIYSSAAGHNSAIVIPMVPSNNGLPDLSWHGGWETGQSFSEGDVVYYDGKVYISARNHVSSMDNDPSNNLFWQPIPGTGDANYVNWRGDWATGTGYMEGDGIYLNNNLYLCIADHVSTSVDGPPNTEYWQLMTGGSAENYSIGGAVWGMNNSSMVLQNNGGDSLSVESTRFEFPTRLTNGSSYNVTIETPPENKDCVVTNGSGTVSGGNVTNVGITCKGWQEIAPVYFSQETSTLKEPQITMNNIGEAIAVWVQSDTLWVNRYNHERGWFNAQDIDTQPGLGNVASPQVGIDDNGNAIVVWAQDDGTSGVFQSVWASQYTDVDGWSAPFLLRDMLADQESPQISMNGNGDAMVVWRQWEGNYFNVWARRYTASGGWAAAGAIENNQGNAEGMQVAIDDSGSAMISWFQHLYPDESVWARYYSVNNGWSSPQEINNTLYLARDPQVGVDNQGNATVVWHQADESKTNLEIWANRFTQANGWSTAEFIGIIEDYTEYPQLGMDAAGNAIVIWLGTNSSVNNNIWSNRYTVGSGWGTPEMIETSPDQAQVDTQQIAMDSSGNAIAIWIEDNDSTLNIWANRYIAGSGWSTARLVEKNDVNGSQARVGVDEGGNGMVIWWQNETISNIRAALFH